MSRNETIYISLIAVVYLGVMVTFFVAMTRKRREREKRDTEFVSALFKAFRKDAIHDLEDVKDMICGFFKIEFPEDVEIGKMGLFLRRTKHLVATEDPGPEHTRDKLLSSVNSIIAKNDEAVKAEKRRIPFAGVPSEQRSLLEDILELSSADEKAYVRDKLERLASVIRSREDAIIRLSDEKGKSLRWARWGFAGTVIFSIISIVLTIWKYKM